MKYKNNIPFIKQGLEVSQISFTGGRTVASLANHGGLTQIDYFGKQAIGDVHFYKSDAISAWAMLFRPCVSINGEIYYIEFNDTLLYPFGYSSHCRVGGVALSHGMWLLNDAIVFTMEVLQNPSDANVIFKLIQTDISTRIDKPTRTWQSFALDEQAGVAIASATSSYPNEPALQKPKDGLAKKMNNLCASDVSSETWLGVVSASELGFRQTPHGFRKFYFDAPCPKKTAAISLVFGHQGRAALLERLGALRSGACKEAAGLVKNFTSTMSKVKISIQGRKAAQSLLNNVPQIIDAMKVKDIPGAMRAGDSGYWVWGWDSMVFPDGMGLTGDTAFLEEMLDFYRRTADPEYGISHQLRLDLKSILTMEFAAQCIYIVLLYHTYVLTGKKRLLNEYMPFAKLILAKAGEDQIAGSGLIRSTALFPDWPADLEQDGDDISVFDNSIYYQALRAMAELSEEMGNRADAVEYTRKAHLTQAGFQKFYDAEQGYFVDSLSAKDFSQRKHYPLYAILWITPFAADLVKGNEKSIIRFMKKNFPARIGLRMFPKWDTRFMYDGCQLGMYMPAIENFHQEMMKRGRESKQIAHMFDNMEWFWNQNCILEALTCECENHGATVDNPGRKQAGAAKAWLNMFYQVAAGLNISTQGLSFSPCDSEDITIEKLRVRGRTLDVKISGRGWNIDSLMLNGENVSAPFTILFRDLKKSNHIVIKRKNLEPQLGFIMSKRARNVVVQSAREVGAAMLCRPTQGSHSAICD